ncbi:MAG: hypothetical protein ACI906_000312 [Candidatus Latescibacterota bacterium]|jgi:hypothetical protein
MRLTALFIIALFTLSLTTGCGNPFAPEKQTGGGVAVEPILDPTTPEILMDNLARAMRDRDKDLYEGVLDQRFWFTETDCTGDLVLANGLEQELEFLGGSRDGSQPGIFDVFKNFEYDFQLIRRNVELGPDFPKIDEDDPDGHPDEDWQVFRGRVQMLLLDNNGDGFRVDQIMTYKMRLADDGLWKIVRWIDDPLSGDCGASKRAAQAFTWSSAKQHSTP